MREIKFRAWVRRLDRMCNVTGIDFERNEINILRPGWHMSEWLRRDQVELMQYSGLDDVNGVNIYEGDVVEFEVGLIRAKAEVIYSRDQFIVDINGVMSRSLGAYFVKVIGNKFENQELLEASE